MQNQEKSSAVPFLVVKLHHTLLSFTFFKVTSFWEIKKQGSRCRKWEREGSEGKCLLEEIKQLEWLTVSCFLSNQGLALSMAIASEHRDLITCLRGETLQNRGCGVSCYRLFPSLIGEQGLPCDPVLPDVPRGHGPRHQKAGVSDVSGAKVSGWTKLCG